jgi:hypothetical protein
MLEIFIVWALGRKIADICKNKGRSAVGWVLLFVLFWFGGEFCGGIAGFILTGGDDENLLPVYLFALVGAGLGTAAAFIIVSNLPSLHDAGYEADDRYRQPRDDSYRDKFEAYRRQQGRDPGDRYEDTGSA